MIRDESTDDVQRLMTYPTKWTDLTPSVATPPVIQHLFVGMKPDLSDRSRCGLKVVVVIVFVVVAVVGGIRWGKVKEGGCRSVPCEQIKVLFAGYTYIIEPLALNGHLHSCFPGAGARPFAKPHGALPRVGVREVTYAKAPARYVGDVGDSEEEPEVGRRER